MKPEEIASEHAPSLCDKAWSWLDSRAACLNARSHGHPPLFLCVWLQGQGGTELRLNPHFLAKLVLYRPLDSDRPPHGNSTISIARSSEYFSPVQKLSFRLAGGFPKPSLDQLPAALTPISPRRSCADRFRRSCKSFTLTLMARRCSSTADSVHSASSRR